MHAVLAMLKAVHTGAPKLFAETAAHWLATQLLTRHVPGLTTPSRARNPGILSDKRLARVLEFMGTHYGEQLTLQRLAHEAGISKFHFIKLFRQATGSTPHACLTQTRLEAGRDLLLSTAMPIAEVAATCGYPRPNYFATAFLARFGQTPSSLRNEP